MEQEGKQVVRRQQDGRVAIFCPGCRTAHSIAVDVPNHSGSCWTWNGSLERPTFSPSLLVRSGHYADGNMDCYCKLYAEHPEERVEGWECGVCHSYIRDGNIEFLADCTHKLAGQTVPLEPF